MVLFWQSAFYSFDFFCLSITPLIGFKFSILLNFDSNELQFQPWISTPFRFWSLVLNLCNLTSNWPLNFQISSIPSLISADWVPRVRCLLQNGTCCEFLQFSLQLSIKLSVLFNFILDFNQLGCHSSMSFTKWSLAVNFFNLALNEP
jgi:hypothetical protein